MTFFLGALAGFAAGFMSCLFYAAWAQRTMEDVCHQQEKALNLWRRGWVPRDWHGADSLAKSEVAKSKEVLSKFPIESRPQARHPSPTNPMEANP